MPEWHLAIRCETTDRKRAEERLREQEALARLGQMAAVVAHEVRNPIAGIRGALQVIGSRMAAESRDRSVVGEIIARLDALNGIVQDLLVFARPRELKTEPVDLKSLILTTIDLLKRDPSLATLQVNVIGDGAIVRADAEQLRLVFQNVLMNSAQALSGGGRIEIAIAREPESWKVSIADNGPGMPPEVRERAFEPFFLHQESRDPSRSADCPPHRGGPRRIDWRRYAGWRRHSRVDRSTRHESLSVSSSHACPTSGRDAQNTHRRASVSRSGRSRCPLAA